MLPEPSGSRKPPSGTPPTAVGLDSGGDSSRRKLLRELLGVAGDLTKISQRIQEGLHENPQLMDVYLELHVECMRLINHAIELADRA
ncbi:MAG: hypothetical protein QOJ65_60 [Fimbriimonadaceae bacterium]|nr:hypothetical protein [Fimbriimonadaceae bacterium]